ncbi:hypothetical protein U5903_17620 [Cereibacter johrii]|uniref:hypothetical protein n=1 Tax=Cereibacter johrii TaxID=445629 RepID=UPI002B257969|nr:hypothetical protein [Cereibacter johrii]MEA5162600.1 hypothetical protein [Cereibacter johrii]
MKESSDLKALLQRAKDAGIETERREFVFQGSSVFYNYICLPNGKDKRRVMVGSSNKAEDLHSIEFERFVFLGGYDAIADLQKGEVEAAISPIGPVGPLTVARRLGLSAPPSEGEELESEEVEDRAIKSHRADGIRLEISRGTKELRVLTSRPGAANQLSLKLFFGEERGYDAALSALEVVSNSLFFYLDLERGVTLALRRALKKHSLNQLRRYDGNPVSNIRFPEFEYDSAPFSLYWYAKSARGMPLLQFLAYYQVAEYYFPSFAKLEAIRTAGKILKNPTFRVDRESDLAGLISAISGNGRVGGSEREQMKATVLEVLTMDDVERYFADNSEVAEVLERKNKLITDKAINLKRKDHDHRPDIAEMLYDIRCRIVHTKNDAGEFRSEMLLPFSSAEEQLWPYTDLMRLVAQNALIRSSSSLRPI